MTHSSASSPSPSDSGVPCLPLKTGHPDCRVYFYPTRFQLQLDGDEERIELGYSGSRLLERLLQTPGEVVSREELLQFAWADRVVSQGSLNQQVYVLRQVLGDEKARQIIQTLPRRGYLFNPDYLLEARTAEPDSTPAASAPATTAPAAAVSTAATSTPDRPEAVEPPAPAGAASAAAAALPRTDMGPTAPAAAAPSRPWPSIAAISALVAVILAGSALLSWQALPAPTSMASQEYALGRLTLIYYDPDASGQQLQQLIQRTSPLRERLPRLVSQPTEVFLGDGQDAYELVCRPRNGESRWLLLHHDQLEQVADEQLRRCLQ
ncbi:MAG: winged helix-turn-helix domain-containing protein [Pseudomonas sp.]|uniref:winged helix-turn-helix domain-containing protein n=1 Tax=Pseudomonas sp. TaxID=306 RepID=UPI00339645E9